MSVQLSHGEYELSTDKGRLDLDAIHGYLTHSYWSSGISKAIIKRSIEGAVCFGVYYGANQVGFARVTTDKATFAYLADVFILEPHRGKGLSKKLMEFILSHPDLQGLRRFMLATKDAHGLYEQFGFTGLQDPSRIMEILRPDVYKSNL